jgi:hypothetical protein
MDVHFPHAKVAQVKPRAYNDSRCLHKWHKKLTKKHLQHNSKSKMVLTVY